MSTTLELNHAFDADRMRHYLNGQVSVLHCHHYATLYTQLAMDAGETDLLYSVAEEVFGDMLAQYFEDHQINRLSERVEIACQQYAALGLGQMSVQHIGRDSGAVVLNNSHVDQGWVKKWDNHDVPVNYITAGYVGGMFAAIFGTGQQSFNVRETESIVQGAEQSTFQVYKK